MPPLDGAWGRRWGCGYYKYVAPIRGCGRCCSGPKLACAKHKP
jgi:hypothetical protein